jgi:hypothetical protein
MGIGLTIRSRASATPEELARAQALVDANAPIDDWQCNEPAHGHLCEENGNSSSLFICFMPKIWLSPSDDSLGFDPDDVEAIHARSAMELRACYAEWPQPLRS